MDVRIPSHMVTATFRFHDQLNEFLPRTRRGLAFSCACAQGATTKHMIEALGVPHTETGTVLVNGGDAGMDRLLADGDCVDVFPVRRSESDTASSCAEPPRFIADAHFGGLARMLRMAGFDTLFDNNFDDGEIADIAVRERRIVLTRDRELLKRRQIREGCYIRDLKPAAQLREVFQRLALANDARPFTRCLHCNAPLRLVDKACVIDRLPPSVRVHQNVFSTCDLCERVYWQGSHWQRMKTLMRESGVAA